MKTLRTNHLGKKYLDQYPQITIKSLFEEVEKELREKLLMIKLDGIEIVHSKGNFGGYRRWFKCPSCSSRAFILYDIGGTLRCRKCSGLFYKSQKLSGLPEEKVYKGKKHT